MRHTIAFITILTGLAAAAPAEAKNHWRYKSRHPHHGGFCHNERPHHHDYAPTDVRVYRVVNDEYYFVGDPVAFGYDGPRHAYYGAHPVMDVNVQFGEPVFCYLEGPHYHWYAPPPQARASFALNAGVFWFTGTFDPAFHSHRHRHVVINDAYRPIRYARPTVVVTDAPSGWRGGPPRHGPVVVGQPVGAPMHVRHRVEVTHPHHGRHDNDKHRWKHRDDDDRGRGHGHGNGHGKGHHKHKHKGKHHDRD